MMIDNNSIRSNSGIDNKVSIPVSARHPIILFLLFMSVLFVLSLVSRSWLRSQSITSLKITGNSYMTDMAINDILNDEI